MSIPRPDPTLLTTAQLLRELGLLQEKVNISLDGLERRINERIVGFISVTDEHFRGIDAQFGSGGVALEAALRAQKDLVDTQNTANAKMADKNEATASRLIEALSDRVNTSLSAVTEQINDVKSRLDRGEGRYGAVSHDRTERRLDSGHLVAIAAVILSVVIAVAGLLMRH